jgi:hypothetical protein
MRRFGASAAVMAMIGAFALVVPFAAGAPAESSPLSVTIDPQSVGVRSMAAIVSEPEASDTVELSVSVAEVARAGTSDWTLTASAEGATVADRSTNRRGSAGIASVPAGATQLARAAVLFRQTGQAGDRLYTGTHVARALLQWPADARGGPLYLTLVQ